MLKLFIGLGTDTTLQEMRSFPAMLQHMKIETVFFPFSEALCKRQFFCEELKYRNALATESCRFSELVNIYSVLK